MNRYWNLFVGFLITGMASSLCASEVLKQKILKDVQELWDGYENFEYALHSGRKSLLVEMRNTPQELGVDLPRLPKIDIGDSRYGYFARSGKNALEQFRFFEKRLDYYLKKQENNDPLKPFGVFRASEMLFVLTTSFTAPVQIEVHKHVPEFYQEKWWPIMDETEVKTKFVYRFEKEPMLDVIKRVEKKYLWKADKKITRVLLTIDRVRFHLNSGEVMFAHKFKFGDVTKTWQRAEFP